MRLPYDTGCVKFADVNASEAARTNEIDDASLLASVEQAASILGIGRTRMFELVMSRTITSVKIGRRRLVVRRSLEEFIQRLVAAQASSEDDH
jgi:excisionase family DNA binding protein